MIAALLVAACVTAPPTVTVSGVPLLRSETHRVVLAVVRAHPDVTAVTFEARCVRGSGLGCRWLDSLRVDRSTGKSLWATVTSPGSEAAWRAAVGALSENGPFLGGAMGTFGDKPLPGLRVTAVHRYLPDGTAQPRNDRRTSGAFGEVFLGPEKNEKGRRASLAAVFDCANTTAAGEATVVIAQTGRVKRVEARGFSAPVARCVEKALRRYPFEPAKGAYRALFKLESGAAKPQ